MLDETPDTEHKPERLTGLAFNYTSIDKESRDESTTEYRKIVVRK